MFQLQKLADNDMFILFCSHVVFMSIPYTSAKGFSDDYDVQTAPKYPKVTSRMTFSGVRFLHRGSPREIIHLERWHFPLFIQRAWGAPISWLVVRPPLWKIWKSTGMIIPNIWENIIHGNHSPPTSFSMPLRLLALPTTSSTAVTEGFFRSSAGFFASSAGPHTVFAGPSGAVTKKNLMASWQVGPAFFLGILLVYLRHFTENELVGYIYHIPYRFTLLCNKPTWLSRGPHLVWVG